MASVEELGKDEMDSLFEGMVLFNPSQMADDHHHQPINHSPTHDASSSASQPLDENLFSDLTLIAPLQTLPGLQSQSDPTLIPPTTTASASATTTCTAATTPSLSRQISSRKKRRAGLRIGYGRDAPLPDDQPPHLSDIDSRSLESGLPLSSSSPLPSSSSSSSSSTISETEIKSGGGGAAQNDVVEEEEEPSSSSSCPTPHSHTSSLAFPHLQPDSHPSLRTTLATTTIVQNHVSENTSKGIDSSYTSTGTYDGALQDDNSLFSDTGPTGLSKDLQEEDKQANTGGINIIESKFEQIRAHISEKLKHARELVSSVSAARKDSTRKRRKVAENVSLASTKYRDLEKELEEACEAEDFETAERVSESLASAEKEKENLAIALRDAEADCDAVDSKMLEVLELQIAAEEECASLLEQSATDAANNADLVLKNAEVTSSKEMDKWFSSTEALEVKKMEIEIESHLINQARLVLNDSIELSVKDDRSERERLCKRKEILTEELEKLLALVKEKEAEIAKNNSNIDAVEKRIADEVSSFQEVQSSIDTKYDNLQSALSQMELDTEALARKKKEIDVLLSQEEDKGVKLRELARISADEANMYQEVVRLRKSLVLFILKSREDKVKLAKTEEKLSEDVQMLRQEVSAARASLQELSSTKSSIQQEIESLKQRLLFIDKRVPELEAEKKVAAAARNFKEAARIASESKALSVEKEGVQIKMEGAILELGKLEEEICDTVNRLQEIESQISSKEKEVAVARFQRLLLIAGAATAERSAALELGDLEEADILLAEAEAAKSEARKLQPVHNLEEEFATLPKHFISMEFVSNLGGKQLAELAASAHISAL
uniref:UVR domain-containing protein n=1 Tax=Davidia involucrata TaxID=16924 RepID=A0A5B6ZA76_DAVIN